MLFSVRSWWRSSRLDGRVLLPPHATHMAAARSAIQAEHGILNPAMLTPENQVGHLQQRLDSAIQPGLTG
jgi:hypothetical protein